MGADVGYEGAFRSLKVGEGTLNELRNLAGMPPADGKVWFMVNLESGVCKWYKSRRRSYRRWTGYRRRY